MEKPSRPVRNRKRSRKAWPPGDTHRPIKRLFTPEIKRMLKDWLVRRRENPYPNREEKKQLACETGLTYTQICNWFANWRRKLKNSGHDPVKKTWGNLIKNYNDNAKGNVEQFSICSSDSIWGEYVEMGDDSQGSCSPPQKTANQQHYAPYCSNNNNNNSGFVNYMKFVERRASDSSDDDRPDNMYFDHCYTPKSFNSVFGLPTQAQCFQITSTTGECTPVDFNANTSSIIEASFPNAYRAENGTYYLTPSTTVSPAVNYRSTNKYKSSIMEKYLRDLEVDPSEPEPTASLAVIHATPANPFQQAAQGPSGLSCELRGPPSLSKWLESTAKFTPSKNNYIDWDQPGKPSPSSSCSKKRCDSNSSGHHQPVHFGGPATTTPATMPPESPQSNPEYGTIHQKDEIDAAEALTRLANNFRMKFYT
ncbi:uncharacterized protein LOC6034131 [Culex quinquefasciatus]|uniref:uncharacterized protein LOC6034131 n=1 Tax=Culex quinquefasciatus TaxID=7176 RepID=UPI0018E3BCAE|nr:uncharacterized protein LOC6034131 [Culex quinquefasciatus]